jgi:hypothetical protein
MSEGGDIVKYFLAIFCIFLLSTLSIGAIVAINEVVYDDSGTDSHEYVELFNSTDSTIDISGWILRGSDTLAPPADNNPDFTVPASTLLASSSYYVIGDAQAYVNLTTAINSLENDNEALELLDASSTIIDTVTWEKYLGVVAIDTAPGFAPEGVGLWGTFALTEAGSLATTAFTVRASISYARHSDGYDTNDNGNDFGSQLATPGRANNSNGAVTIPYSNNFDGADNTEVQDLPGAFGPFRIQDPGVADSLGSGTAANPNIIPASPQGGNVGVFWDSSGGGNASILNLTAPVSDVAVEFYAYLDTTFRVGTNGLIPVEQATLVLVRGTPDPSFHNFVDVVGQATSGHYGILWLYSVTSAGAGGPGIGTVSLVERKDGVNTQTFGSFSVPSSGWYRIFLQANGTNVVGFFDGTLGVANGQAASGTTSITRPGGIGFGYREFVTTNAQARPLTIDALSILTSSTVPVELSDFNTE